MYKNIKDAVIIRHMVSQFKQINISQHINTSQIIGQGWILVPNNYLFV